MAKFNPKHHTAAPSKPLPPCKRMKGETCPHQMRNKSTEYGIGKCSNCTRWKYYKKGLMAALDALRAFVDKEVDFVLIQTTVGAFLE